MLLFKVLKNQIENKNYKISVLIKQKDLKINKL